MTTKTNVKSVTTASPEEVANVLRLALTLIKGGWMKHSFKGVKNNAACFCADGALRQAAQGNVKNDPNQPGYAALRGARAAVYKVIAPKNTSPDIGTIYGFNDKRSTTKEMVVAAFTKAIKQVAKAA